MCTGNGRLAPHGPSLGGPLKGVLTGPRGKLERHKGPKVVEAHDGGQPDKEDDKGDTPQNAGRLPLPEIHADRQKQAEKSGKGIRDLSQLTVRQGDQHLAEDDTYPAQQPC